MRNKLLAGLLGLIVGTSAHAVSVSFLKGNGFRDDLGYRSDKVTMTIENFAIWELGSVFFYYDITEPTTDDGQFGKRQDAYSNQFFGGISPTFSLSKMTGKDFSFGPFKDVSIRLELENGSGNGGNNFQNYFYGLQYDVAIPGFDFFSFNTVIRDNPNNRGVGFQIGAFWQMSTEFNRYSRFKFTGFLATSPWDGDQDRSEQEKTNPYKFSSKGQYLTTQPQFLYDLGYALWGKQNRMEVGFEYAYFLNRFQLDKRDEKVLQYMVKMTY